MRGVKNRNFYRKKRFIIPAILIVALIAFRLYLPTLVKNYVNKVLANIPGFYGQVDDIDIALIRGAYVINGLYLNKVNAETQVPFLNFPETDISIEWKSLLRGKIVSEIIMDSPEVIYVFEDQQTPAAEGKPEVADWTEALTDLVPIDINHFEIHNGKVAFVQLQANPDIDLQINQVELTADNLRNVRAVERTLPSPFTASGVSIGDGKMSLNGHINLMKQIPDLDLEFALENAQVTALNDLTNHYAGVDFESGTFGIFSEIAIADGHLTGYLKTLITDSKLISKEDSFVSTLWEGFVSFFKFILKNQKTDTLATKVPLEGDLNNVQAGVWPTIFNIFKNAWIQAFTSQVDNDIEFKDAFKDAQKAEKKEEKAKKKEEKRQKKAEKKAEKAKKDKSSK